METIGKFRTNFLGKGISFKIGFNNRSPFSYISSSGPSVPSSYDGGVPLVNFTPDQYAKAFDTSDAVRAEQKMYEAGGKAAGQTISAMSAGLGLTKDPKSILGEDFANKMEADPDEKEEINIADYTSYGSAPEELQKHYQMWAGNQSQYGDKSWKEFVKFWNEGKS